ncbi:MAG: hypothetical protein A2Z71_10490 [Chloroflexi bacterium RBG_13_50_21]|nr:MAG: hypothetical protein A2Z71_10490 [Chloroflexi bacterium RBG_13_50_21]OGO63401.1 MAG: hypothetical protein A2030_02880 [Chloroflexi bacterium RBG_19FT_COMBO_50_10]
MKTCTAFFHCGEQLIKTLAIELDEIKRIVEIIPWSPTFKYHDKGNSFEHQGAYNKAFYEEFIRLGWECQPLLRIEPKLIGDFRKGLVFVEIQFGNSSALYRDYYKFQYGLANGLLSIAILISPTQPNKFFPTRPKSVQNMAEFDLAYTCFTVLPINVPVVLIGLLPEN